MARATRIDLDEAAIQRQLEARRFGLAFPPALEALLETETGRERSRMVDKRAAETGQWRTREGALLGVDLAGGIAGGLLAQQMLRHKTAKAGFIAATVAIALAHLGLLLALNAGFFQLP